MKWTIRILSLLQALFVLSLWLFNEDVRAQPTPAILFQLLLTLVLLAAWRWEKAGGLLAMSGGLIFFLLLVFNAAAGDGDALPAALLGSILLALPYVALGWLFFVQGRQAERGAASQDGP